MPAFSTDPIDYQISPGIVRNYTVNEVPNRYVDGDNVRFVEGKPEKIGGYQKELSSNEIVGVPRKIKTWQTLDTTRLIAVGTHNHFYIRSGGTYYDLTPLRKSSSLTDPLTTTSGSSEVQITDTTHGALVGDYVNFPSPVTYNGITFDGDYEVIEVVDANNFVIEALTNASGSGTGGGSFTLEYYLTSGLADTGALGFGWGTGTYGSGTYGTTSTSGLIEDARLWATENWGEDLLLMHSGGAIYFWDKTSGVGTRPSKVTDLPDENHWMILSSFFRRLILLGTEDVSGNYDPMLIRWTDEEDYTELDPTVDGSSAGEYRLTSGTKIIGGVETRNGEILVFTDTSTYRMRPRSDNSVYEVVLISSSSGLMSPNSVIDVDGTVYWISNNGFRYYDGIVRILPSTLDLYYFDPDKDGKYNFTQKVKTFIGRNREFDEIIMYMPTGESDEINRYVIFNYEEGVWSDGSSERTCWADSSVYDKPYAYNREGDLYIHERGKNADTSPLVAYITSGYATLSPSDRVMFSDQFIPDGDYMQDQKLTIEYKKYPNSSVSSKEYTFNSDDEFIPIRIRGRYVAITVTSEELGGDFRIGTPKFSVKPNGQR